MTREMRVLFLHKKLPDLIRLFLFGFSLRGQVRFGALAGNRIQNPFAQTDGFRGAFKELVSLNIR